MDNTEVDLIQMVKTVWDKKKQILFYTFLIVIGSVLFAYFQPVHYEVYKIAYVLSQGEKNSKFKNNWPAVYYETFSRNPEILKAVMENLPKDVKFEDNISPLTSLSKNLHVQHVFVSAFGLLSKPAIKLIYTVRHTDRLSAQKIANTWQKVLEVKFEEILLDKISKKEEQIKSSKIKWNEAKNRLIAYNKNFNVNKKELELKSKLRIITSTYLASEAIMRQMDSADIVVEIYNKINVFGSQLSEIEGEYLAGKETLSEYKKLLRLQPKILNLSELNNQDTRKDKVADFGGLEKNIIYNPIHMKLQEQVVISEVLLKKLGVRKTHLEKRINSLESKLSRRSEQGDDPGLAEKKYQLEVLAKKIKRYEKESSTLENQILEKTTEKLDLVAQESSLAGLVRLNSKDLQGLKLFHSQNYTGLSFASSAVEPEKYTGVSLREIAFFSFVSGLVFTILLTLIKASFSSRTQNEKPNGSPRSDSFRADMASKESKPGSDSLKESKPKFSRPS
jgi:hypothetical protein